MHLPDIRCICPMLRRGREGAGNELLSSSYKKWGQKEGHRASLAVTPVRKSQELLSEDKYVDGRTEQSLC
jgi:hypothetical protein